MVAISFVVAAMLMLYCAWLTRDRFAAPLVFATCALCMLALVTTLP